MKPGKVILCDLGGVLIDLHWVEHAGLFGKDMSADELKTRWLSLNSVLEFEPGMSIFRLFISFCDGPAPKSHDRFK